MSQRIPGFLGEYLWELDIARNQLLALASAAPEEMYAWRPIEGVRCFSAVLAHIAACNFGLVHLSGASAGITNPFADLDCASPQLMIRRIVDLERSASDRDAVIDLLRRSFQAVEEAITSSAEALDTPGVFFGETTTLRRLFLRMLTHSHEHMGQAVAYARVYGLPLPWPDPLKDLSSVS